MWLLVSFDAGNQAVASELSALEADLGSTRLEEAKNKARDLEADFLTRRGLPGMRMGWRARSSSDTASARRASLLPLGRDRVRRTLLSAALEVGLGFPLDE